MEHEIIIIIMTICILMIFRLSEKNFYLYSILSLPSTTLHELTHLIMSYVFNGQPINFNIFPKKKNTEKYIYYELGYVTSVNIRWYNGFIIGMSPFLLLIIAYFLFFSDVNILYKVVLIPILIHGGIPSTVDFKLAFESIYFILFCVFLYLYAFFFHKESIIILKRSLNEIFIIINDVIVFLIGHGI